MIGFLGRPTGLILFAGLLVAALIPGARDASAQEQAAGMSETYAERGAQTCIRCHDTARDVVILNTPHAQMADSRTPFAAHQCESCHGASPEHLEKPAEGQLRAPVKVVFGTKVLYGAIPPSPAAEQNKVCMGCHQGGLRMNWAGSQHQFADVPCAACHTKHALKDPALVKATQPEACFGCHLAVKAQAHKRSRHPIREGKVVCSDCHNPHGSFGPRLLVKQTINETCYGCHAEKRGPFLWEHAPVREDCTLCHTPHGSTQPRMLKIRTPYLCQTCHSESFHPSTLYSGTGLPEATPGSRLLAKGCLNCHPQVHGTNHPSGPRLTR